MGHRPLAVGASGASTVTLGPASRTKHTQPIQYPTLLDGGTGTELRARGVDVPSHLTSIWSAKALLEDPEAVVAVHRDYIEAGADVITVNNYAVTRPMLAREGMADRVEELTIRAAELAHRARDQGGRDVRIAGSLPPLSTSYRADMVGDSATILGDYRQIAECLAPFVDLLLCETLSCSREARAAATAARGTTCEVWLSFTLQGTTAGHLPGGESLSEAIAAVADLDLHAYLVNCCGANFITEAMATLADVAHRPYGGYGEALEILPRPGQGSDGAPYQEPLGIEGYAGHALRWLENGASIIGGCCSTGPAHIARLRQLLDD